MSSHRPPLAVIPPPALPEPAAAADQGVGRQMAVGAIWMVLARAGVRSLGLISTVILARLLTPEDYGIVGLATLLYFFVQSASEFSLDTVLIQSQTHDRDRYDTVWTMEALRGVLNAVIVLGLALPAARIMGAPQLVPVAMWIALGAIIAGLANVGPVEFRSDLRFSKQFLYTLLTKLASFVVAVPAAFILRNYWALVIGLMTGAVARLILSYVMHPYRPRPSFACWREVFSFSKWLWCSSQLFFLRTKSDEFFVSKWAGIDALGYYKVARELAELPTSELITPMLTAIFPSFSRLSNARVGLGDSFLGVLGAAMTLMAPLSAGLFITADLVLRVGFGPKWLAATPLLELLAFAAPVEMFAGNTYALFVALGHPRYFTWASLASAGSFLLLLAWLVPTHGTIGAAVSLILSSLVGSAVNLVLARRVLALAWSDLWTRLWRPVVAAAGMVAAVAAVRHLFAVPEATGPAAELLLLCVAVGAVAYAAVLLALWQLCGRPRGGESMILGLALPMLRQRALHLGRLLGLRQRSGPPVPP